MSKWSQIEALLQTELKRLKKAQDVALLELPDIKRLEIVAKVSAIVDKAQKDQEPSATIDAEIDKLSLDDLEGQLDDSR